MKTINQIENRIRNTVPEAVLNALSRRQGQYTDMVSVFHCLQIDEHHWVGVAGDGDNASYEHFSLRGDKFECSDAGYGDTLIALRDVLQKEVV